MEKPNGNINFHYDGVNFFFPNRTKVKSFVKTIIKKEKRNIDFITYVFTSDVALLALNQKYLNHDYKTDILTFPLSFDSFIQAEIYISIERVRANAKKYNVDFREELLRVIFHGVLHLCGYKDKRASQIRLMRAKEDYYLALYQSFT